MAFEDNHLLFGSDPTARIVAIEMGDTGRACLSTQEMIAPFRSRNSTAHYGAGLLAIGLKTSRNARSAAG